MVERERGCYGLIARVECRPKALHSLNYNMVHSLLHLYKEWAPASEVSCILLKANGSKAFCAGGDVKGAVQDILAGHGSEAMRHGPGCFMREVSCRAFAI